MKLDFVEIAGFRGFREKARFEFPAGFAVFTGRNGAGKSTVLDAVGFALTGTINKFAVKTARGGGLDEHVWWVGSGRAAKHYVTVGFSDGKGEQLYNYPKPRPWYAVYPERSVQEALRSPSLHNAFYRNIDANDAYSRRIDCCAER
jgi:hypothetical protein